MYNIHCNRVCRWNEMTMNKYINTNINNKQYTISDNDESTTDKNNLRKKEEMYYFLLRMQLSIHLHVVYNIKILLIHSLITKFQKPSQGFWWNLGYRFPLSGRWVGKKGFVKVWFEGLVRTPLKPFQWLFLHKKCFAGGTCSCIN